MEKLIFLMFLGMCFSTYGDVTIERVGPVDPVTYIGSARIAVGDVNDKTPNPCWDASYSCGLGFVAMSEREYPILHSVILTADRAVADARGYETLGEWAAAQRNLYRVGQFTANSYGVIDYCIVLATLNMTFPSVAQTPGLGGKVVSNCVTYTKQEPVTCSLKPDVIDIVFPDLKQGENGGEIGVSDVSLSCTGNASVHLGLKSGTGDESIGLGTGNKINAQLNWGQGFGQRGAFTVKTNVPKSVPLRARLRGIANATPGVWSGSAVAEVSYD